MRLSSSCALLTRVRQVSSPRKSAKMRLERVQKINKVSKSLFGPVIKSEFRSYAQMEMTKYQLQASTKWSFDFVNESPITSSADAQYQWESATLSDVPRFYHHIVNSNSNMQVNCEHETIFNENICPLSMPLRQKMIVVTAASMSGCGSGRGVCYSQTKITDYLKIRKRRLSMSTTSAVCMKKARADF